MAKKKKSNLIGTISGETLAQNFAKLADPVICEITLDQLIARGNIIDATKFGAKDESVPVVITNTIWEIFGEIPDRTERIGQVLAWVYHCLEANGRGDCDKGFDLSAPSRYYQMLPGDEVEIIIDCSPGKYQGQIHETVITVMHACDD